jgi:hypothetical protein
MCCDPCVNRVEYIIFLVNYFFSTSGKALYQIDILISKRGVDGTCLDPKYQDATSYTHQCRVNLKLVQNTHSTQIR